MKKKKQDLSSLLKSLNIAWELGFIIALPAVIFTVFGLLLDKLLKTTPLFTIILIILGSIAGFYLGLKEVKKVIN